jgi:hypothetical protein
MRIAISCVVDKRSPVGANLTINGRYAIFYQWGGVGWPSFNPSPQGRFFNYSLIQGVA